MKSRIITYLLTGTLVFANAGTVLSQAAENAPRAAAPDSAAENALTYTRPSLSYQSGGKRDPFESLAPRTEDEERKVKGLFNYEQASLKGIVNTDDDSYALVADVDGNGYVLREGYRVFGGYVTDITDDTVNLHIVKYGRSLSIIMRLESSRSTTVFEQEEGESFVQMPGITINYRNDVVATEPPTVQVEEVILPDRPVVTVEQQWFDSRSPLDYIKEPAGGADDNDKNMGPALVEPAAGELIVLPFVFDWTVIPGDGITYTLIIDDTEDFSSPLATVQRIQTSSFPVGGELNLPAHETLFWKVVAVDTVRGVTVESDMTGSFRIRQ